MPLLEILNQYGFATLAAIAMGWFIWFIYTFITQEVTKKLSEASGALIQLLDKIRRNYMSFILLKIYMEKHAMFLIVLILLII